MMIDKKNSFLSFITGKIKFLNMELLQYVMWRYSFILFQLLKNLQDFNGFKQPPLHGLFI